MNKITAYIWQSCLCWETSSSLVFPPSNCSRCFVLLNTLHSFCFSFLTFLRAANNKFTVSSFNCLHFSLSRIFPRQLYNTWGFMWVINLMERQISTTGTNKTGDGRMFVFIGFLPWEPVIRVNSVLDLRSSLWLQNLFEHHRISFADCQSNFSKISSFCLAASYSTSFGRCLPPLHMFTPCQPRLYIFVSKPLQR